MNVIVTGIIISAPFLWLIYGFLPLALYRWYPPYRRWRGTQIYKTLVDLWNKQDYSAVCRFAERTLPINQIARDEGSAGFGLRWAEAALFSHEPKALELIQKVIQSGYFRAMAQEVAGMIFFSVGDTSRAEQWYEAAKERFRLDDDTVGIARVLYRMAGMCALNGQFEQAQELCREASKSDNATPLSGMVVDAVIQACQGRYEDALVTHNRALSMAEGVFRVPFLINIAKAELQLGHAEAAQNYLQEACALAPMRETSQIFAGVLSARASALLHQKTDALAALQKVEMLLDRYIAKRRKTGRIGVAWPAKPQTRASAASVSNHDHLEFTARYPARYFYEEAGIAYHDLGEFAKSLQSWNHLLAVKPDRVSTVTAYYYIGECRRALGDVEAAAQSYREAVDLGIETHCAGMARERLHALDVA